MTKELPSIYQTVIAKSRYARYIPELQRRETWEETVDRYINYMYQKVKDNPNVSEEDRKYIHGILGATCDL
jgi:ribonucleoside-diphosphate reductase alpha chain